MYPGVAARGALHASTGNVPGGIMGIAEERGLMKRFRRELALGVSLIALAAVLYLVHYVLFRNAHHIFIYLVGDLAFLPIEVLLVTIIIHRLLTLREKRVMLKKLNMVIGAFFSEVGTQLLKLFSSFDPRREELARALIVRKEWTSMDFSDVRARVAHHGYDVSPQVADIEGLKQFLIERRPFLLGLLENQNLLEHESFTNLLWAVFHLAEELAFRRDTRNLHRADREHLAGDMKRAYALLVSEWLAYMEHLMGSYPYLFSLAMRTNPFDTEARPEVQ